MVGEERRHRRWDRSDPELDGRSIVHPLGHEPGDRAVLVADVGRRDLDERCLGLAPAEDLTLVQTVRARGSWHRRIDLHDERDESDHRCGIVGADAEREVPVLVRRADRRQDDSRALLDHELRNLGEVRRDERQRAVVERGSGDVGEEPRDVVELAGVGTVEIGPIPEGVHLVDPHSVQPVGTLLECVEELDGLTVRDRDDDVGIGRQRRDQGIGEVTGGRPLPVHVQSQSGSARAAHGGNRSGKGSTA